MAADADLMVLAVTGVASLGRVAGARLQREVRFPGLLATILGYIRGNRPCAKGIARMGLFRLFQPVSGLVRMSPLPGEGCDSLFVNASGLTRA